jgi:hypothetical protein
MMLVLIVEKIIQHTFVTLAFYFDWQQIRSTVAVNPDILMVAGVPVIVLFIVDFWGMLSKRMWSLNLLIGLALFDIIGEFIAQGTLGIVLNVSFIVAVTLLLLAVSYRRQVHRHALA